MKTTIEISEPLLEQARRLAAREKLPLRELVERGLQLVIEEHRNRAEFVLRDARVGGEGVADAYRGAAWDRVREAIYEDHGG